MATHLFLTHIRGLRMNTPNMLEAPEELNTMESKWEVIFAEVLENKNLSVKDIETAKFMFFSGAYALFELFEELRPASSATKHLVMASHAIDGIKEEVNSYLGHDDEADVWVTVPHNKDKDGKADSRQE